MKQLFLSECRRFRTLALVATCVHLLLQLLASRMFEPLQAHREVQTAFLAVAALCGLAFAVTQFSSYRQPSRWVWLMHRPLAPGRVFAALSLASLALLVLVIGVPAMLAVIGTDSLTGRTVDSRHYFVPLHLLLTSFTAWLAAAYLMLSGRRFAFVVLFVPWLLIGHLATGQALLAPALVGVAMMAALARSAFKPDRTAPPAAPGTMLAAAIPLVLGCYCVLLWGGSTVFQAGQMLFNVHPLNRPVPPAGGYTELARADGRANLQRALAGVSDPRAAHWRRQVDLLAIGQVRPEGHHHPVRGQLANSEVTQWRNPERNIVWTFNHDRMLFEGRDLHTDAPRGWYGEGGQGDLRPLDSVPVFPGKCLLTATKIIAPERDGSGAHTQVAVRAPETLSGCVQEAGNQSFVLTNQRLIAYRKPATPTATLQELYSVALPGAFNDLEKIDVARMLDGTLLSFDFGRRMSGGEESAAGARQQLVFVDTAGRAQTISDRPLAHDFPPLFEHRDWWLSPAIHALLSLPERLLDKGLIADAPAYRSAFPARPPAVIGAALAAALLSAALAAWRLRNRPLSRRLAWCVAALLLGPAAVAAMWMLTPRPVRNARPGRASAVLPVPTTA